MSSYYKKLISLVFFLGIIFITFASDPPPRQLFLQDGNNIWLGTEQGLHRYQTENELWSTIKPEPVTDIFLDEDMLWLGTAQGLFYADLRYLDWKKYSKKHGLPSDSIVRIVADLDFIYSAGPNGLARMDKLVEQWETIGDFSSIRIYDLYSDQDNLWVATDSGIFYFEKQYEKWKQFTVKNGLISNRVFRIFYFNDYVWTLTDKGFSRYSTAMKTWNSYSLNNDIPGSAVNYLWLDADYIWIVAPEGIVRYNGKNQTWENFSRNTPLENLTVHALSTSGKTFWFATSDGVYSFQEEQRRWITYTAIEGLSDDEQENIFCVGQTTISKKSNTFCVYYPAEDLWHTSKVSGGIDKKGKTGKWDFYDDERGLGFSTPGEQSASLLGRAYFKLKNKAEFPTPIDESIKDYVFNKNLDSLVYDTLKSSTGEDSIVIHRIPRFKDFLYWWTKAQLNLNVDLNKGRTLRGSFDNTDPLGDLNYGVEYLGYGDDHLRKAGWLTDQKTDYFFSTLIDPTYLEGAGVRTEFGSRVGEKKRRRVNTGLWAGWRKTKYLKKLIPFQEDNFYYLNVNNIITESVELRVDGKIVDPREYSIERTMGLLTFKNEGFVNPDSRIEISLEYEPELGEHTNEMVAAENVVVFSDNVSVGANGVYRGIEEPDRPGTGLDTNRLVTGSVNGKVELKSNNGKMIFKALPEVSTSYNDSIVIKKQGTAAKLNGNAAFYNFKMKGLAQIYSSYYETLADITSIYGRMNHQGEVEATFDITPFMPVTTGFSLLDASAGEENMQYLEYLVSPAGKPSLKLKGLHQNISCQTQNDPHNQQDSIKTKRWNGHIETEWDFPDKALSILHLNRLWLNTSYSLNFITDSLFDSLSTGTPDDTLLTTDYLEHLNHNLFGWLQVSPHKNITLETKQIFRFFQQRDNANRSWKEKGNRFRPEFTLFSQEFIPGITLYGKYGIENSEDIFNPEDLDTTGKMLKNYLNTSILLILGVWCRPLNPF